MSAWLPESLRTETRDLHRAAERSAFMGRLLRGEMQRPAYLALLRNLLPIYTELEAALRRHGAHPVLAPLALPGLWRGPALRRDIDSLQALDAGPNATAMQPATVAYIERLRRLDATAPALLAAHSYVRYLGDLSGGQILGGIVRRSLDLGEGGGTAFYDFGDTAATDALRSAYREALAALPVDRPIGESIVAEARHAFELHRALFEQLQAQEPMIASDALQRDNPAGN